VVRDASRGDDGRLVDLVLLAQLGELLDLLAADLAVGDVGPEQALLAGLWLLDRDEHPTVVALDLCLPALTLPEGRNELTEFGLVHSL
jgi:hypothetical protein